MTDLFPGAGMPPTPAPAATTPPVAAPAGPAHLRGAGPAGTFAPAPVSTGPNAQPGRAQARPAPNTLGKGTGAGRPARRLLDLFSGAGGCAVGYHRAGFDVTGVDIKPQPRYPFEFIQADVFDVLANTAFVAGFDVLAGSPPCRDHTTLANVAGTDGTGWMLAATRDRFEASGKPYVIENVPGAAMRNPVVLCGSEFGLTTTTQAHGRVWLRRHRLFESNVFLMGAGGCNCYSKLTVPVYGGGAGGNRVNMRGPGVAQAGREVMGIDWMTRDELNQAIPPAFTEFIGRQLLDALAALEAS